MKKYELTEETKVIAGVTLKRIRALISFGFVAKGEIGGFIEGEKNLSHDGNARVADNARVTGNADCMLIGRIGSRSDFTTFFKNKDGGISVRCGCFYGTIEEFREKVEETHGTDTKHAKVYQAAANLAEMQILEQEAE